MFVLLAAVSVLIVATVGADFCPNPSPEPNFDITKVLGKWFVAEDYGSGYASSTLKCPVFTYILNSNQTITIKFKEGNKGSKPNSWELIGRSNGPPGAYFVSGTEPDPIGYIQVNWWFIATNENWMVAADCNAANDNKEIRYTFVHVRDLAYALTSEDDIKINEALKKVNVQRGSKHTGCEAKEANN